jgi:hypothetical protein
MGRDTTTPEVAAPARGRGLLLAIGGVAVLAGTALAVSPGLVAASARTEPSPLSLLATRELGLVFAALGALFVEIARTGTLAMRRTALGVLAGLAALLASNHALRVATEREALFEAAHSYGEIAALAALSLSAFVTRLRSAPRDPTAGS